MEGKGSGKAEPFPARPLRACAPARASAGVSPCGLWVSVRRAGCALGSVSV